MKLSCFRLFLAIALCVQCTSAYSQNAPENPTPLVWVEVPHGGPVNVTFTWSEVSPGVTYRFDLDSDPAQAGQPGVQAYFTTNTSLDFQDLSQGDYFWRVRVNGPSGGPHGQWSGWHPLRVGGEIKPSNRLPADQEFLLSGSVGLSWNDIAGATAYRMDVQDPLGNSEYFDVNIPQASTTWPSATEGVYRWRVRVNLPVQGNWSDWNYIAITDTPPTGQLTSNSPCHYFSPNTTCDLP